MPKMAVDRAQYIFCLDKIGNSFLLQVEACRGDCHLGERLPVHNICIKNTSMPGDRICPIGKSSLIQKRVFSRSFPIFFQPLHGCH
jgi:hypothetical protein